MLWAMSGQMDLRGLGRRGKALTLTLTLTRSLTLTCGGSVAAVRP